MKFTTILALLGAASAIKLRIRDDKDTSYLDLNNDYTEELQTNGYTLVKGDKLEIDVDEDRSEDYKWWIKPWKDDFEDVASLADDEHDCPDKDEKDAGVPCKRKFTLKGKDPGNGVFKITYEYREDHKDEASDNIIQTYEFPLHVLDD